MSGSLSGTGRCQNCGSSVPSDCVIIEYDREDQPAAFAECPNCRSVVATPPR